jgi:hypothetical protein
MSRRLTFVTAAALGVTLTLTGCSSDDNATPQNANQSASSAPGSGSSAPGQPSGSASAGAGAGTSPVAPPAPSGGDPVKWVDNLCAPIGDFTKSIATKMTDFGNVTDQSQIQAKLGQFLDEMASGLGSTVDRLKQLEPSPVKGGDDVKNKIVESYQKSQAVLKDASTKMKAGDQDAAGQVMQSLGDETSKMVDPFKDNDNAELRDAMSKAPKCKDIPGG